MTVTVITVSPLMIAAMAAVPLICAGGVLQLLSPRHQAARLTGTGLLLAGWVVFGMGEAAARDWPLACLNGLLSVTMGLRAVAMTRAPRGERP